MLAAEARSIPDQNQNQTQNQAHDEIKIERESEPERRHGLAVDSRSTKTLPNDKLKRDPRTTSLPRSRDEPNHIRLSQREFEKGLEKRSMEKQRRQPTHPGRRIEEDQDVLIGPFHARNQQEIELKKMEFLEKSKNTNRQEIKRWALEQVESRNVDDDLLGVQSDHHQAIINSFDQDSNIRDSFHSNDQSHDLKLKGRQLDQDGDLLESSRREEQLLQEEDLQEDESYSNWLKRQTQAEQTCFVGNDQLSCYPNSGTEVVQDRWSKFIWNKNYPRFAQIGFVDVYLFRQDQDSIQTSWTSLNNNEGRLSFSPTDSYWQGRPRADNIEAGQNITWPFYFVVTYAGAGLSGTTDRQSTWSAIQTAVPVAVASSRSAASASSSLSAASASIAATATSTLTGAAASSASASDASVSSSIVASLSRSLVSELQASGLTGTETLQGTLTTTLSDGQVVTATATGQANGSLSDSSNDDGGGGLPKYAIALIVVFGFLALVAALVGIYFLMAAMRKRRNRNDSTMGSTSPMMRDGIPSSIAPSLDAGTAGGVAGAGLLGTNRSVRSNEDDQLFTSDEATRMADAFRAALRKPEFASPFGSNNQSGDDDDGNNGDREDDSPGETNEGSKGNELLRSELASEGYDLRPVQNRGRAELHGED